MAASNEAEASVGADRTRVRSLAEALPDELRRARELLVLYREIGPAGAFGALIIEQSMAAADQAMASGDVIAMLRAYKDLEGLK